MSVTLKQMLLREIAYRIDISEDNYPYIDARVLENSLILELNDGQLWELGINNIGEISVS